MNEETVIAKTAEYVKDELKGDCSGHDWWHTFRVWKIALYINQEENADTLIVQLAALLHDIADYKVNSGDETLGPKVARTWLERMQIGEDIISQVCNIIFDMSFRGAKVVSKTDTIEGMIVQDADRLDAIGAIGIARAFAFGGYKGHDIYDSDIKPVLHTSFEEYKDKNSSTINHFYEKLLLLKDLMNTKTAKRVAEKRHQFMLLFLDEFLKEWEGRDIL